MSAFTDNSSPGPDVGAPTPREVGSRLFVVGCARSGTTLLQSFLAAHPAVLSFPETAVFGRLLGGAVMPSFRVAPASPGYVSDAQQLNLGSVHRRAQLAYRCTKTLLDTLGRRDLEHIL